MGGGAAAVGSWKLVVVSVCVQMGGWFGGRARKSIGVGVGVEGLCVGAGGERLPQLVSWHRMAASRESSGILDSVSPVSEPLPDLRLIASPTHSTPSC